MQPKKESGFSGGWLIAILVGLFLYMTMNNLAKERTDHVSYSYQAEHLINLDLIDNPRMSTEAENLVVFSGKYKTTLPDTAKDRFNFLQSLDIKNKLKEETREIQKKLTELKAKAYSDTELFLLAIGFQLPRGGVEVVSPSYDRLDEPGSTISITTLDKERLPNNFISLVDMQNGADEKNLPKLLKLLKRLSPRFESAHTVAEIAAIKEEVMKEKDGIHFPGIYSVASYGELLRTYEAKMNEQEVKENEFRGFEKILQDKNPNGLSWFFNDQEISTKALEEQKPEIFSAWFKQAKAEYEAFPASASKFFKAPEQPRKLVLDRAFTIEPASKGIMNYIVFLPVFLIAFMLYQLFARQKTGAAGAMSFGKSPAKLMTLESNKTKFADVAGCDEAKEELVEIVEFLKDPRKFTNLGARIPKGVLLFGSPGTGKTLLARAVAGEAGVPFYSISGSDFVEMFVGVGASRIRDMFKEAKKNQPCIIFIDEIDAVGRQRGAGIGGGHDEREQTLNQLLVEMDGFDPKASVIIIAATNRPDVLDSALLRPGRFDRQVTIDLPDLKGRLAILKVHAKNYKLDEHVDLEEIAKGTSGCSGATLANLLNEAALAAAKSNRKFITQAELLEARDKVLWGKERRSLGMDEKEKTHTAYHESGHAVIAKLVPKAEPVHKVTIIPRGQSLGSTQFLPEKNRLGYWASEIEDQVAVLMGGRAAEEIFVKDKSSGASQDFAMATRLVRAMVLRWGMDKDVGTVTYEDSSSDNRYGMDKGVELSEETRELIDKKVHDFLTSGYERALKILTENKDIVETMTKALLDHETIDAEDVDKIMARNWDDKAKSQKTKDAKNLHKSEVELPPLPPADTKNIE